jgi:FdhD protein
MKIQELYRGLEPVQQEQYTFVQRTGETAVEQSMVLTEHLMDVYINERLTMKLVCTPQHLTELVLGRLLSEGVIRSVEEVALVYICESGRRAKVMLTDEARADRGDYVQPTPTCCTGNRILNQDYVRHGELASITPIAWTPEQIFALADRFNEDTPLHQLTGATHSCMLAQGGKLLFSCEDIGRHNALDKAMGYALRHDIALSSCIAYSSGRLPTDMVEKAIRAGIPVLCTKASPTAEAVQLAKEYRLTLICTARTQHFRVITQP